MSNLSTTSKGIWSNEIVPHITETIYMECKADEVLMMRLEDMMKHVENDLRDERNPLARIDNVVNVIGQLSYLENSPLRRGTETARQAVRDLEKKLRAYQTVYRIELSKRPKPEPIEPVRTQRLENRPYDAKDLYRPVVK